MKKTSSALLIILALVAAGAWAQDAAQPAAEVTPAVPAAPAPAPAAPAKLPLPCDTYPNALGFMSSSDIVTVSGFNLHYQRWFNNIGMSLSAGGMKSANPADAWGADAIVELQYKLSDGNLDSDGVFYGALYAFVQSGYVIQQSIEYHYDGATSGTTTTTEFSQYIPAGIGVGLEAVLFKHVSMPLEVGFVYRFITNVMTPSAMIGIRYRF
jgi:hypothetical protein